MRDDHCRGGRGHMRGGELLARRRRLLAGEETATVKTVACEDLFCITQKSPTIAKD
jgi:hypothetical protein